MIHRIALACAVVLFGFAATASAEYRIAEYHGPHRGSPTYVTVRVPQPQAPYALTGAAPEARRARSELRMIPVYQGGSRVTYIYARN